MPECTAWYAVALSFVPKTCMCLIVRQCQIKIRERKTKLDWSTSDLLSLSTLRHPLCMKYKTYRKQQKPGCCFDVLWGLNFSLTSLCHVYMNISPYRCVNDDLLILIWNHQFLSLNLKWGFTFHLHLFNSVYSLRVAYEVRVYVFTTSASPEKKQVQTAERDTSKQECVLRTNVVWERHLIPPRRSCVMFSGGSQRRLTSKDGVVDSQQS